MKIPQRPPSTDDILKGLMGDAGRFLHVVGQATGPTHNERYLHWDKLRRLSPPPDLTHKEWWWLLRSRRSGIARPLPLTDSNRRPFHCALSDIAIELLHGLDKDAAGQILVTDQVANPEER